MANLKPFLDSNNINLEKRAVDAFGAAVETFNKSILNRASTGQDSILSPVPTSSLRSDGSFYASSYAHALAGGTSYRPKLKFLFKVEFIFTPEAVAEFQSVFGGERSNDFTFMVKSVDRPKIDFEYDDDVNHYNFRTKVLKRIRHRELTITFMDDAGNRVLNFFRALMMMHSPITRRQLLREGTTVAPDVRSVNSGNGMVFSTDANNPLIPDNAIRGVTNNSFGNVIETIRVKQIYVDPGEQLGNATKEVIYDFINARIVSFDLDELTHEASDPSIMTMQFDYDWMEIVDAGALSTMDGPNYNISVPGVNGAPVDMTTAAYGGGSGGIPGTFGSNVTNSLMKAAQSVTSSAINRLSKTTAGNGLANAISDVVNTAVSSAARDLAGQITRTISQATARASTVRNIIDSAVGPRTVVSAVKSRLF